MKPRFSARLLFAAIGAAACLLGALVLDGFYSIAHTGSWISHDATPALLFFPHVRNDTDRRLREANAQSGDVEITLTWNNLNDLDLHCIDPNGQHIFYGTAMHFQTRRLPSDGILDVDRNAGPPYMQHPVEHIYWPRGHAPPGTYQVFVDHFGRHGGSDPTAYEVTVKEYGRLLHFSGAISHNQHREDGRSVKICDFTVRSGPFAFLGVPTGFWRTLLVVTLWAAMLTGLLCAAILGGLSLYYRRVYRERFVPPASYVRLTLVSSIWGGVAGAVTQSAYTLVPLEQIRAHPTLLHSVDIAILGAIVGLTLGGRVPHLRRGWAFLAGFIGGGLAGYLFFVTYHTWESLRSETAARVVAAAVIGAAIGFVVALVVKEPEKPAEPEEVADETLDTMQPLSLRANRIGPTGKLRRAGGGGGGQPARR